MVAPPTFNPTSSPTTPTSAPVVIEDPAIDIAGLVFGIVTILSFGVYWKTRNKNVFLFAFITYCVTLGLVSAEAPKNILAAPNYNDTNTNIFISAFSFLIISSAMLVASGYRWMNT